MVRPHPGHAATIGVNARRPMVCKISCATMTSLVRSPPGSGERPVAPVYIDGEKAVTLKGERIAEEFQALVDDYVKKNFATGVVRKSKSRKKEIPIKVLA